MAMLPPQDAAAKGGVGIARWYLWGDCAALGPHWRIRIELGLAQFNHYGY